MPATVGKKELESYDDQQLVRYILEADQASAIRIGQGVLFQRYSAKVYYKCLSIIKDAEMAKDLTHDIFIRIFSKLDRYQGNAPFYSWVFAITYNYCFDFLKKRKRHHIEAFDDRFPEQIADESGLQQKILEEHQYTALAKALEQLPEGEQVILRMYYEDQLPVKEIAEVLELNLSAVKMRLKRGRDHLAKRVNV